MKQAGASDAHAPATESTHEANILPALVKLYFEICLLRANPQDLPASSALLALTLGSHVAINIIGLVARTSLFNAVQAALIDTLVLVALVHTALLLRNVAVRSRQTLSAITGCGAMLSLLAWPVFQIAQGSGLVLVLVMVFLFWQLAVFGHILRHALSLPFIAGVAIAILYLVVSVGVIGMLGLELQTEIKD